MLQVLLLPLTNQSALFHRNALLKFVYYVGSRLKAELLTYL